MTGEVESVAVVTLDEAPVVTGTGLLDPPQDPVPVVVASAGPVTAGEAVVVAVSGATYVPPPGGGGDDVLSGPAGGVLSGTYPDPGFAVNMTTQAELDAHIASPTPHPTYDDLPSLTLQFLNGLI